MSIKSIVHNGADRMKHGVTEAPKKVFHAPGNGVRFTNRVAKRTFLGAGERVPFLTKIPLAKRLFTPKVENGKPAIEPLTKKEIFVAMAATGLFTATVAGSVVAISKGDVKFPAFKV